MGIRIALAGNPNCGKTTMFNALTGANQYVGNWPGVTVEKKEGRLKDRKRGEEIIVTDLPGIYSLSPYTLEEVVSRDYLLNENPDVIVDLVDATNIERNLYLTTQLIETGIPVVIALNMSDLIGKRGLKIDSKRLSMVLGCPVVETSALKKTGLGELIDEAVKVAHSREVPLPKDIFSDDVEAAVSRIADLLTVSAPRRRWYAVKVLENDEKVVPQMKLDAEARKTVDELRRTLEEKRDDDIESIITDERYRYIQKLVSTTVKKSGAKLTVSDRIDRVVTNRILGIPIFIAVMFIVYYISVTTVGTWVTDWTNDTFGGWVADLFTGMLGAIGAGEVVKGVPPLRSVGQELHPSADILRMRNPGHHGQPHHRAGQRQETDDHDGDVHPLRGEASRHIPDGRRHSRRGDGLRRVCMGRTCDVLPGGRGGSGERHHSQEDQTVLRKARTFRHGASSLPCPVRKDRSHACLGAIEGLHHQGRNHSFPGMCRHVVPGRLRFRT